MRLAWPVSWKQLVIVNVFCLALATACEARNRAPEPAAPAPAPQAVTPEAPGTGGAGGAHTSVADLVDAVKSSVVNVEVQARSRMPSGGLFEHFFGMPPGGPGMPPGGQGSPWGGPGGEAPNMRERIQQGQGSGFIIDPTGLILTNNHVVENAVAIRVQLDDGRAFDAKVLGRDPLTDLALLKIQGEVKDLPVAKLGNSDEVRVGDGVVAIGNPFGLASSVSAGILSARARDIQSGPYDNFLQTDAAINPGNSGGPLFNMKGEVIGINTAIVGGGTGIGFAVPSNMANRLLPQLQKGEIRRGWLGVSVQDLTPELAQALNITTARKGAIITDVQADTPAAKAGLKTDDVILRIDNEPIESSRGLTRTVGFRQPGETVKLDIFRNGKAQQLSVKLGERPDLEGIRQPPEPEREEDTGKKLGVQLQPVDPRSMQGVPQGALIVGVDPGSPADRADLSPGMVIVEAGGKPIKNPRELAQVVKGARSGAVLLLRIQVPEGGRLLRAITIP